MVFATTEKNLVGSFNGVSVVFRLFCQTNLHKFRAKDPAFIYLFILIYSDNNDIAISITIVTQEKHI